MGSVYLAAAPDGRLVALKVIRDELADNAEFRRRFRFNTFNGTTPLQFDERLYALRSGMQNFVTAPSAEIADRLAALRFGARQRWQTKRGPAERRRIGVGPVRGGQFARGAGSRECDGDVV